VVIVKNLIISNLYFQWSFSKFFFITVYLIL